MNILVIYVIILRQGFTSFTLLLPPYTSILLLIVFDYIHSITFKKLVLNLIRIVARLYKITTIIFLLFI